MKDVGSVRQGSGAGNDSLGTAQWAESAELNGLEYKPGALWIGQATDGSGRDLGYRGDGHAWMVCQTRGGKGASVITNTLLDWPGSVFVIDPKGENASVCAARRGRGSEHVKRGMWQKVVVLDPFRASDVDEAVRGGFNPLDMIGEDWSTALEMAAIIAEAMVEVKNEKDPFWEEAAQAFVKVLLLFVASDAGHASKRNLGTVRDYILSGSPEMLKELVLAQEEAGLDVEASNPWAALFEEISLSDAYGGLLKRHLAGFMTSVQGKEPSKLWLSINSSATTATAWLDEPQMRQVVERSDFEFHEFKTSDVGLSVFLCLPFRLIGTHKGWLRMLTLLGRAEMERVPQPPKVGHPVLMMLDEFASMGRMPALERAATEIAGFGVRLFFVTHSLAQVREIYKENWETLFGACDLRMFFNIRDFFTAEYASKLIGDCEVVRVTESRSFSQSETTGTSHSETKGRSGSQTEGRTESETEGSNRSHASGFSRGSNSSRSNTRGSNTSRSTSHSSSGVRSGRTGILWQTEDGWSASSSASWSDSTGQSFSTSTSQGTNFSKSSTDTVGTSQSNSSGRSESATAGWNDSETMGWNESTTRQAGTTYNETIHRVPLLQPSEVMQLFTPVEQHDGRYPGLALVLVPGRRPVIARRQMYYETPRFGRSYDPHPIFGLTGPTVDPAIKLGFLQQCDKNGRRAFDGDGVSLSDATFHLWHADIRMSGCLFLLPWLACLDRTLSLLNDSENCSFLSHAERCAVTSWCNSAKVFVERELADFQTLLSTRLAEDNLHETIATSILVSLNRSKKLSARPPTEWELALGMSVFYRDCYIGATFSDNKVSKGWDADIVFPLGDVGSLLLKRCPEGATIHFYPGGFNEDTSIVMDFELYIKNGF